MNKTTEQSIERKNCKCECHFDGRIRHTRENLCCKKPEFLCYPMPCKDVSHTHYPIEPEAMIGLARITDIKKAYPLMEQLWKYCGGVMFSFDPNTKSLDIHFKRGEVEWDYGAGIQINELSESDKKALREYLENGQ